MGWNRCNKFRMKIEDATVRDLWQHKDLGSFHTTLLRPRAAAQRGAPPGSLTRPFARFVESSGLPTKVMFFIYMRDISGDHGFIGSATDV
jgi:hypothetical protein